MENRREKRPTERSLNKFKILKSKVMNEGKGSEKKIKKNKKTILRKERLKKEKIIEV